MLREERRHPLAKELDGRGVALCPQPERAVAGGDARARAAGNAASGSSVAIRAAHRGGERRIGRTLDALLEPLQFRGSRLGRE